MECRSGVQERVGLEVKTLRDVVIIMSPYSWYLKCDKDLKHPKSHSNAELPIIHTG